MKTREAALYIGADPLTFNDISLIEKCIQSFGFITILLDRKNRDTGYREYYLNYADRMNIIKHDLAERKITQYHIVPIDESVQYALSHNDIQTLVLNLDFQQTISFRMLKILQEVCPDLNILCMSAPNFIERHFIKALTDADSTMQMYKKYCTDYSFFKFKLKNTHKIALSGNLGSKQQVVLDAFHDRGYHIVDIDAKLFDIVCSSEVSKQFIKVLSANGINSSDIVSISKTKVSFDQYKLLKASNENSEVRSAFEDIIFAAIQRIIATEVVGSHEDKIVVNFSFLYESELDTLFDEVICIHSTAESQMKNLIDEGMEIQYAAELCKAQFPIEDKVRKSDYILYSTKQTDELKSDVYEYVSSRKKF